METPSTEKEMKDHSQPEDTLNNKEGEGSAADNLKCLYLRTEQFAKGRVHKKKPQLWNSSVRGGNR